MAVLDGDYDAAEKILSALVQRDSREVDSYLALARLFRKRGEIGRAIRIHQNILLRRDLAPASRTLTLTELAADYAQGGFLRRAIAAYEEVLEHDSRHEQALSELTRLLADAGDHAGAIVRAKRLAKVRHTADPRLESDLLCQLARSCQASGEVDAARKAAKRAIRTDPENAVAHVLLGQAEAERGRNKAALQCWKAALATVRAHPGNEDAALEDEIHLRLEATFAALERTPEFVTFMRAHLQEHPTDVRARLALARHLGSHEAPEEALSELEQILALDPGHLGARVTQGRILLAEHRDDDAVKQYAELLRILDRRGESPESEPGT